MARNVPKEPPYRWRPLGTVSQTRPPVGSIVAWRHAAWRVVETTPRAEVDWTDEEREWVAGVKPEFRTGRVPWVTVLRPVRITADDPRSFDRDVHLAPPPWSFRAFEVYPSDHYPACVQCGEPAPCRDEMARVLGEAAEKDARKYEIPGVCPSCGESPTGRHKVMTFEENIRIPLGPPVTFHVGRRGCRYAAAKYEREMAGMVPGYRTVLWCPGHVWKHADGPDCTEGDDCRGLKASHQYVSYCDSRCLRCKDVRAAQEDSVRARNAAGDWTTW